MVNTPKYDEIEKEYENIKGVISKVAAEVLRTEVGKAKLDHHLLSEEVKEKKINEKSKLDKRREKYQAKNRDLGSKIKLEKNLFWGQKCVRIDNLIGGTQSTETW
mgnify:CR=1 FL=1